MSSQIGSHKDSRVPFSGTQSGNEKPTIISSKMAAVANWAQITVTEALQATSRATVF